MQSANSPLVNLIACLIVQSSPTCTAAHLQLSVRCCQFQSSL
uniref:Uncharacterized protein n=1 Tax=Anguilla anguilla TaxID=7936 RepID=A0A0E9QBA6_ANGAN